MWHSVLVLKKVSFQCRMLIYILFRGLLFKLLPFTIGLFNLFSVCTRIYSDLGCFRKIRDFELVGQIHDFGLYCIYKADGFLFMRSFVLPNKVQNLFSYLLTAKWIIRNLYRTIKLALCSASYLVFLTLDSRRPEMASNTQPDLPPVTWCHKM